MSEQPGFNPPGYGAVPPAVDTGTAAYQQAASDAVGQVQEADQGTDAGPTIEAIKAAAIRQALGEFEAQVAAQMAAAQAAFDNQLRRQQAIIGQLAAQIQTVRAKAGPPDAVLLARSLAQRAKSIAVANPDLGAQHFTGLISQTATLEAEVAALADGNGDQNRVEQLAHGVELWFTRTHPRLSGKVLEGWHAALDEAERIVDGLGELTPVAAAVVKAL